MVFLMIVLGVAVTLVIVTGIESEDWKAAVGALILLAVVFIGFPLTVSNRTEKAKADTLIALGYKPYTEDQLYNMTQADKDKCIHIVTIEKSYYFPTESK